MIIQVDDYLFEDSVGWRYGVYPMADAENTFDVLLHVPINNPVLIGRVHHTPHGWFANGAPNGDFHWQIGNFQFATKFDAVHCVISNAVRRLHRA